MPGFFMAVIPVFCCSSLRSVALPTLIRDAEVMRQPRQELARFLQAPLDIAIKRAFPLKGRRRQRHKVLSRRPAKSSLQLGRAL